MRRTWLPCALILLAACSRNTSEPGPSPQPKLAESPAAPEPPSGALPPGHVPVGPAGGPPGPPPGALPPGHVPVGPAGGPPGPPPGALPPGHVPVGPAGDSPAADGPLGEEAAGGLAFHAESPFVRRPPGSSMRAAEYVIDGAPEWPLTVFFFPGQGGGVDANVQRWVGQFRQPDGTDSSEAAQVTRQAVKGVDVTRVELRGAYGGGMTLPGQQSQTLDEGMLLAAIAEGSQGPVFFKWVGPAALLGKHEAAFDALIGSLAPAP